MKLTKKQKEDFLKAIEATANEEDPLIQVICIMTLIEAFRMLKGEQS